MDTQNKVPHSDEEDELETLRLAALQTLKKSALTTNAPSNSHRDRANHMNNHRHNPHGYFPNKKGRFAAGRRDHFQGGRQISSNLIPLTPVEPKELPLSRHGNRDNEKSVFLLPQDKYNNKALKSEDAKSSGKPVSKFDRYNDTDKSDEDDSEDELLKSDTEDEGDSSPTKLERSDSLEALMQQLDDEIQGKAKAKNEGEVKVEKVKTKAKKKKETITEQGEENVPSSSTEIVEQNKEVVSEEESKADSTDKSKEDKAIDKMNKDDAVPSTTTLLKTEKLSEEKLSTKKRPLSPSQRSNFRNFKRGRGDTFRRPQRERPQFVPASGPPPLYHPNIPPPIFNTPPFMLGNPIPPIPPFYGRPLSPIRINAESLQTQTMAPLSPRSARFVLENRAIIEKRKRSPRRSYSRSPSPRDRSLSPRRRSLSPSPLGKRPGSPLRRRSNSPLRKRSPSPLRKRSRSPRKRSISPRRRSLSPKKRNFSPKQRPLSPKGRNFSPAKRRSPSPGRRSLSPRRRERKDPVEVSVKNKPSIRERLGHKPPAKPEENETSTKSPAESSPRKDDKPLDPILEARKKKFESKEINLREGIIRLRPKEEPKPELQKDELEPPKDVVAAVEPETIKTEVIKVEPSQNQPDELTDDILLNDDELDLDVHMDLFSDGSISESEGRLEPVTEKSQVQPEKSPIRESRGSRRKIRRSPIKAVKKPSKAEGERSRSPRDRKTSLRTSVKEKKSPSKRLRVKTERHPKKFERKIEIKIKNPSKYEQTSDSDGARDGDKKKSVRKVEMGPVGKVESVEVDDDDTEIIVENDEVENAASKEGDLRAQLSKKRAEKLHKTSSSQGVPSRLLQSALEPIKKSKKSKSKELTSSGEGKLPIHLRLGIACSSDMYSKPKRKSKRRKNIDSEQQV